MREVLGIMQQMMQWIKEAWHLSLWLAARFADAWPEGQLWKQLTVLLLIAVAAYAAFLLGRKIVKALHHLLEVLACLLVVLLALIPTVVITFLALVGGFWIAKSL